MKNLAVNKNLDFLRKEFPKHRLLVLEGGTRSGKTWSALQYLVWLVTHHPRAQIVVTIARRYKTDAMKTVYSDFEKIVRQLGLSPSNPFRYGSNVIQFIGAADSAKLHGLKQDVLYCNEVLEFDKEEYDQLAMRTTGRIIADYNPSFYTHWFYDYILATESVAVCHSTYLDNPHLSRAQVLEIESYKDKDPEVWRIYGQGLRRERAGIVFRSWTVEDYNWDILDLPVVFGLDFGYTSPSALIGVKFGEGVLYVKEFLYRSYLSTDELARLVKSVVGRHIVACDSAEPRTILEMQRAGINAVPVRKKTPIIDSIRLLQTYRMVIAKPSVNLVKEVENYAFVVDSNGLVTEEPLRVNDHAIDALRYAAMQRKSYYSVY